MERIEDIGEFRIASLRRSRLDAEVPISSTRGIRLCVKCAAAPKSLVTYAGPLGDAAFGKASR